MFLIPLIYLRVNHRWQYIIDAIVDIAYPRLSNWNFAMYKAYRKNGSGSSDKQDFSVEWRIEFYTNKTSGRTFVLEFVGSPLSQRRRIQERKRFSKGEKRTVAALLSHIKELTKHDSHKSHNRCEKSDGRTDGRTRRESLSLNRNIHETEQILFWQPSSEESTVERNPPSGLSLIAELQRNYAAWDSSSTTQSVANSRSKE